jgi:hypothetical protein
MRAARWSFVLFLGLILIGSGRTNPLAGQDSLRFEYAVKMICGSPDRPAVAPGRYYTAINIHNPGPKPIVFAKKFALTGPSEGSLPPTSFGFNKLGPDYAMEVDCTNRALLERRFVKGFAVIQTPIEVDVVAVYTAGGPRDSLSVMELERVSPRGIVPKPIR